MEQESGRGDLTAEQRLEIYHYLLARSNNGVLAWGSVSDAASIYMCHRNTIGNVWKMKGTDANRKGRCGRKAKRTAEDVEDAVRALPLDESCRSTLRSLATATGIPKSTLGRLVGKKRILRRATSSVQPQLSPETMIKRLKFALSFVSVSPRMYSYFLFSRSCMLTSIMN